MTTAVAPYARILFVGPDLSEGSFAEVFRARLVALRGEQALRDVIDTGSGYDLLWQTVGESARPLLVIDLEPQTSSAHLDWLRSELMQLDDADRIFVASAIGTAEALPVEAACALIERPELHLPCINVAPLPAAHAWSKIPLHEHRVLLCNGPRCTRRGALPLWKGLREKLKAAGRLECEGGVHITRTQCQFPCDQGPTLSVYPAGKWYRVRNEAEVTRLVDELFVAGREVPELLMPDQ
ncbi:(2Fe-2S) ferredoxin domain-containing protein [Pseudomonas stutzeri]|uniref:2Fe-2S ferredoxin n=1 Tax=Stutzerimonas stutzeri TaxID=316 RepID=A0A2N8S0H0_STUST|nr:(2Fe-2S) ferredoxin domain-containing protein [Stutzerimonas stutzeri]MCQ4297396.1 (2Fe-2S) ferredoxin domain-containing protein [Stutzerimonas stutzeri]PNF80120.1 2Fe-2S ferredoxin [Stutzerimonas stutzeri]